MYLFPHPDEMRGARKYLFFLWSRKKIKYYILERERESKISVEMEKNNS